MATHGMPASFPRCGVVIPANLDESWHSLTPEAFGKDYDRSVKTAVLYNPLVDGKVYTMHFEVAHRAWIHGVPFHNVAASTLLQKRVVGDALITCRDVLGDNLLLSVDDLCDYVIAMEVYRSNAAIEAITKQAKGQRTRAPEADEKTNDEA